MEYLDFEVEVAAGSGGSYTVSVLRSPAGEAVGTMRLPFDALTLENRLQALQIALLRSASTRRRVESIEDRAVSDFGRQLYEALFNGQILTLFEVSREEARERNQGLRLKLRFSAPELAVLPWEYLFDPARGDFLSLSVGTPLVRYIPLPLAMEPLEVIGPLRMLGLIVSPSDMPELDAGRERQRLEIAVEQLRSRGAIELEWLPGQTWRYLQAALRRGPWHIFHFVGHGGFDEAMGEGFIQLADEEGRGQRFSATDLGRLLGDHESLRLAVLNACEGARGSQTDLFSSTSAVLVRHGTPAVVAMQYEITDTAAIEFSRSFYDAVADGMPVDASLAEARKGLSVAIPNTFEWGTPVLHMRSPDGVLFHIPAGAEGGVREPDRPEPSDVLLSFDPGDATIVGALATRLREATSIEPILQGQPSDAGRPADAALERAVDASAAVVVLRGPGGQPAWEREPMRALLERRTIDSRFRIVPVLLPGANLPDLGQLPRFVARVAWVDLRAGVDDADAFAQLVDIIQSEPAALTQAAPEAGDSSAPLATDAESDICPFRGLEAFDEDHAEFFFGREALTQQLVEQLRDDRFLAVLGPSGSGKSSVVRAGLIPALHGGALGSSASWPIVVLRPGAHPLESLAARLVPQLGGTDNPIAVRDSILSSLVAGDRGLHAITETALAAAPADQRLVIVVDQFEEVFTLCRDDEERRRFVATLLHASSVSAGQTIVVLTMRADFFGKSASIPDLAARIGDRDILVPPMEPQELRRAMILPAERVGLRFEKGLVDTIVAEMGREPGVLPLLQHTLLELWEGRRGGWLTMERYREIGGVRGAIAQRAEAVYSSLDAEQQRVARRVLLRLTQPGQGTETTRRRASMAELVPPGSEAADVEEVVRRLVDARLITSSQDASGDVLDVAHEALIKGWPRLQSWVDENPAGLRLHRRLTETVAEWTATNRDPSYLYRGGRLQEAVAWLEQNPTEPSGVEREFIAASREVATAERAARQRRTRVTIGSLVGVTAVLAVLTAVALVSWGTAESQRAAATNAEFAARARYLVSEGARLSDADPRLGLRLAIEGLAVGQQLDPPLDLTADVRTLAARGRTLPLGEGIEQVIASADGSTILVDRKGAPGELRSGIDGQLIAALDREVADAAFTPTSDYSNYSGVDTLVSPSLDGSGSSAPTVEAATVADAALVVITYNDDSREIRRVDGTLVETPPGLSVLDFSQDPGDPIFIAGYDSGLLEIRRATDGELVRSISGTSSGTSHVPDAQSRIWVIDTDDTTRILTADGKEIRATPDLAQIRDEGGPGANLLACFESAPGEIWSRVDGSVIARLEETCGGPNSDVTFDELDPDRFVLSNSESLSSSTVYRLSDGAVLHRLEANDGGAVSLVDGSTGLIMESSDAAVLVRRDWGAETIARLPVTASAVTAIPGGRWFLVEDSTEEVAELRSLTDGHVASSFPLGNGVSISPDGRFLEVEAADGFQVVRLGTTPEATDIRQVHFDDEGGTPFYLAVFDDRTEVRHLADDRVLATLPGSADDVTWGAGWAFIVDSEGQSTFVRLDDALSVPIPNTQSDPMYVADGSWPGVVLSGDDLRTSVWSLEPEPAEVFRSEPAELVEPLGVGLDRFVSVTTDGRAYLVDMSWVRGLGGVDSGLAASDLVAAACGGPLSGLSLAALEPYLGAEPAIACTVDP